MDTDTQRVMSEIESKGYVRPGETCGDWSYFYRELGGDKWKWYILYLDNVSTDWITLHARDDKAALQYVTDTFIPGTEYELFERVCQYRKIN